MSKSLHIYFAIWTAIHRISRCKDLIVIYRFLAIYRGNTALGYPGLHYGSHRSPGLTHVSLFFRKISTDFSEALMIQVRSHTCIVTLSSQHTPLQIFLVLTLPGQVFDACNWLYTVWLPSVACSLLQSIEINSYFGWRTYIYWCSELLRLQLATVSPS